MFARILKIFGIVALCAFFLFGAVEIWVYRNKEKFFRTVQEMVNENLNGHLEIEDFKFRPFKGQFGLNFTMENVKLTDSLYQIHKKPFLEAEYMQVALDLQDFYKGDIKIKNLILQNGSLKMFVQKDGYSNLTIFRSSPQDSAINRDVGHRDGIVKKLGNLRFINFAVSYSDSVKEKYYGAIFHDAVNITNVTDTATNARFTGSVFFTGLTFKPRKGGFLVKQEAMLDLALSYNEKTKKLQIAPSSLESATREKIGINGEFDFSDTTRAFNLSFKVKKIAIKNALPLLTRRLREQLDSIGIQANVDAQVKVDGKLNGEQPRVDVFFKTEPFKYELPVGVLRNMQTSGHFTNQADTAQFPSIYNSQITAPNVVGMFEKIPFKFSLAVTNFFNPVAKLDGVVSADSSNMNELLDPVRYKFRNGTAKIDFHFDGSLKNFYDPKKERFNGKLSGKVALDNISMDYLPRQVRLAKIKGDFTFNEKVLVFPAISLSDGQNMMYLQGTVVDLVPYLFGSPRLLTANVNINIPTWKLNWLETLLAPRKTMVRKKKKLKLSELLDEAIDQMQIVAKLDSKNLKYRNFNAKDVKGQFTIKNNAVSIEYFTMKAFGKGSVRVSGEMDNSGASPLPRLAVRGNIKNADVHSVFYSFDNFGQKTFTHDNLKGILSTDFNFESRLNNNVRLVPATMKGNLSIDFKNGYIINFEPFMKMKRLIFKKRNFERVKFAPIRTDFVLKGQEIEIQPMEIESNVLTLYIDGIYSFGTKTDINIQIPLSNLKKRDSTYVLDPNNEEKKDGSKIFLRAIDENGEVNIKLAFRKKKDKEKDKEKDDDKPDEIER